MEISITLIYFIFSNVVPFGFVSLLFGIVIEHQEANNKQVKLKKEYEMKLKEVDSLKSEEKRLLDKVLEERWSPRAFSDEVLNKEDLISIFNSGKQVASSYNEQPWAVLITDKGSEAYAKVFDALSEFNREWVKTAPHLGIVLYKKHFTDQENKNPHALYDSGAFMAVASLRATILDIYVHQMAGFSNDQLQKSFDFPEDYEIAVVFTVGKLGETDQLSNELKDQEEQDSERKPARQFLFAGEWGNPLTSNK